VRVIRGLARQPGWPRQTFRLRDRKAGGSMMSAVAVALAVTTMTGCLGEPEGPDSAAGTRSTGGDVEFWLGEPCADVSRIEVDFRDEDRDSIDRWSVEAPHGGSVETFTAGVAPNGFVETDALDADVATADIAVATVTLAEGDAIEVVAQVADHRAEPAPDTDSWDIIYRGWTGSDEVGDLIDDGELAPACELAAAS